MKGIIGGIVNALSQRPEIGVITSIGSGGLSLIDSLIPGLRVVALVVGIFVGLLTGYVKFMEAKKLRNEGQGKKDQ